MIKIERAIIVEGKYDKIRLQNIVDAVILTTDGFGIFKNREKRELIRKIAEKKGLLIITDSDKAGSVIRSHIKGVLPGADIVQVYLPQISGKERRKHKAGAEGLLGVEGTPDEIIIKALERFKTDREDTPKIEKSHLYDLGLSGDTDSAIKRKQFLSYLELPTSLSANALLDALNSLYSLEEFLKEAEKWQQGLGKN